jgi:hypothetical protein
MYRPTHLGLPDLLLLVFIVVLIYGAQKLWPRGPRGPFSRWPGGPFSN